MSTVAIIAVVVAVLCVVGLLSNIGTALQQLVAIEKLRAARETSLFGSLEREDQS